MIISLLNPKGGSGKTTICTNLARMLARDGRTVLIIDLDPQGTARDWQSRQGDDDGQPDVIGADLKQLKRGLQGLRAGYDVVLIDGSAKTEGLSGAAVKASDLVLIPVQPSPADIWGVSDLVEIVRSRQEVTEGRPRAAFVISRQIVGTNLAGEMTEALVGYELPVFEARTSQRVAYAEAMIGGATVVNIEPYGKAAREIEAIYSEMLHFVDHGKKATITG